MIKKFAVCLQYKRPDGSLVDVVSIHEKDEAGMIMRFAAEIVRALDTGCFEIQMGVYTDDVESIDGKDGK